MLQDIAILTGAKVISEELGYDLKEATIDMLGTAQKLKLIKKQLLSLMEQEKKKKSKQELNKSRLNTKHLILTLIEKNFKKD